MQVLAFPQGGDPDPGCAGMQKGPSCVLLAGLRPAFSSHD